MLGNSPLHNFFFFIGASLPFKRSNGRGQNGRARMGLEEMCNCIFGFLVDG